MDYLLQHLLLATADKSPDKIALICRGSTISYGDLDRVTNQLAHCLRAEGVTRGDRIGIYLNKSVESILSILGILKAGGVYVPLDPAAPAKRLAYIIGNCDIRCLISSSKKLPVLKQILCDRSPLQLLILAARETGEVDLLPEVRTIPWRVLGEFPSQSPPPNETIETDLAYILYTSGSTGDPKGVMITHRNALTFINWAYDCLHLEAHDRLSNHAPLHFDLSIFDIFDAIKVGATLCPIPDEISVFPASLAQFIAEQRITVWYSVPSALIYLLLHGNLQRYQFPDLRLILFAGEVFPIKYLRELKTIIPHADFYNLYGPTETNVCTFYRVREIEPDRIEPLSIGKACANTEVFAVNEKDERIQPGEMGELYVRGPSLMKGYWGLPEKTQELLIPNRFQPGFEEQIYRTGDLVSIDEDGYYIFIGRRDNMIKSRGYRIELGEIEAVLYSHSQVKEGAAIAVPDEQIGNRIKAFIVPHARGLLAKSEIIKHCNERLPHYMVPELIEFRDDLPKTSTGKIDRKLLS